MREYVVCICFVMLLCAAVDMLVPSKKYKGIIKIVCGIFVIGTIVSPIKELISFDYSSFDIDRYLKDDYGFFITAESSRQSFEQELIQNGKENVENEICREIKTVFDIEITAELENNTLKIHGTDESIRNEVADYIKKHYDINVICTD